MPTQTLLRDEEDYEEARRLVMSTAPAMHSLEWFAMKRERYEAKRAARKGKRGRSRSATAGVNIVDAPVTDAARRNREERRQRYIAMLSGTIPATVKDTRRLRLKLTRAIHGGHTPSEWIRLKKRSDNRCCRCYGDKPLQKDHKIPLSLGGTDLIDNIQALCHECHRAKDGLVRRYSDGGL